jgi:hypothetical protein
VKARTLFGLAVTLLALAACGGTETGNPSMPAALEVSLSATTTDESAAAVRSADAALSVEAAWLSVRRLELEPCSSDAAAIGTDDYPLDLANDPPASAVFESSVSEYCGVRLEIAPAASGAPPELEGLAVHLFGTRSDGVPFEIASSQVLTVVVESTTAGTPFDARHLVLGLDLATWFAGADVHGATTNADGIVFVDHATNPDVLTAFEANTALAVALYADPDHGGIVDDDELTPIAASH